VHKLATDLRAARHPETGAPIADFVVTREESFAGPYDACAPDVSIMPADGLSISILRSETAFRPRETVRGNHRFDGIFIAAGPGIRQGDRLTDVSILDVTPLILHTLGVAQPMDLDGRVPDVLTPDALARRPVTYATVPTQAQPPEEIDLVTPFAEDIDDVPLADVYDEEDEATVINRLRTLGYVE